MKKVFTFFGAFYSKIAPQLMVLFLCASLAVAPVAMTGCTPSQVAQFENVLNQVAPAVATILQIVALFNANQNTQALPAKVGADVAAVEKLFSDYESAPSSAKGSIEAEVNAAFSVLQSDLQSVFQLAQVSDKNTQAKIAALVGLIGSALQIAEGFIVSPAATAIPAVRLTPASFVGSWNKIVSAKTGNARVDAYTASHGRLHLHSKFVRIVSLGMAN